MVKEGAVATNKKIEIRTKAMAIVCLLILLRKNRITKALLTIFLMHEIIKKAILCQQKIAWNKIIIKAITKKIGIA